MAYLCPYAGPVGGSSTPSTIEKVYGRGLLMAARHTAGGRRAQTGGHVEGAKLPESAC